MPMTTKEVAEHQLEKSLAKRLYKYYFRYAHDNRYYLYKHVQLICDALQRIIDGERVFIIIEMPPRHGKSASITETFPSYYLMNNPDKEVMMATYSEDLYNKFGRRNRDKFARFAPELFNLQISQSTSSASEWGIEGHDGGMFSTSILSGATGRGADLLIIDDPVKNAQEAESQTIRDKVWDEWQSTFSTRLHDNSSCIVIMTRWNQDDLVGRLLQQKAYPWEEIRLPAIAESDDDILGRKIGEPLCPELGYDADWAKVTEKGVGSRVWAALYQQRPAPEGGAVFKQDWVKYYVPNREIRSQLGLPDSVAILPMHLDQQVQSWDATFKKADTSDFVAGQVWGRRDADRYLLDRVHGRLSFTETLVAIESMTNRWPKATTKYIEDKANGSAIIDTLQHKISGITPITPDGGKESRAYSVTPLWEAGNVYVPHPAWLAWEQEFETELISFPNAPHDDEVDSMTQALDHMGNGMSAAEIWGV